MRDQYYRSVLGKASFGFASLEVISDKEGNPVDFRIEDVNSVFENISGISGRKLKSKTAAEYRDWETDRKSTRLNSSHSAKSRMPSSA